ncbi:PREDICTED: probable purine permease 4 [Prunus mume]|uniref:Probable purine permease n=1 Tax=Prunus mume TaxID=102107 RepID=A0ABM0NK87_PRUMU|nr:PREDICTED: probable purine permease 4 [Prunus mume]
MESLAQASPKNSPKSHHHGGHHQDQNCPTVITVNNNPSTQLSNKDKRSMPLLVINYLCLFIGSVSSSLLSKYYFIHKGSSIWVSTWVQCAGFPLLLPFVFTPYYLLNSTQRKPFSHFTPKILTLSIFIGLMLGLNNFLFSWGNSYLPVSTSSLLLSSQLVFNLILSVIIVKQKITFSNLNCVILLTISSVLLALGSSHDKPPGLTRGKYFLGFFSTIGAGLLFALYLPVMEKIYSKVYCYAMVIEMQLVMQVSATALATLGMALNGAFREMKVESMKVFDKGQSIYWVTVLCNVVTWQLCFMGTAGMVFLTSSLTGGICMTALMGMNVLGGVLVYGDEFGGVKVVSTLLCGWGFCSYAYGIYMNTKLGKEDDGDKDKEDTHQGMEMGVA